MSMTLVKDNVPVTTLIAIEVTRTTGLPTAGSIAANKSNCKAVMDVVVQTRRVADIKLVAIPVGFAGAVSVTRLDTAGDD